MTDRLGSPELQHLVWCVCREVVRARVTGYQRDRHLAGRPHRSSDDHVDQLLEATGWRMVSSVLLGLANRATREADQLDPRRHIPPAEEEATVVLLHDRDQRPAWQ